MTVQRKRARSTFRSRLSMADFEIYIDDDRYQVPSLYLITAHTEARVKAMADELLRSSRHHRGVELRRNGERLFGMGSLETTDRLPDRPPV
jgi:hypothetical protein